MRTIVMILWAIVPSLGSHFFAAISDCIRLFALLVAMTAPPMPCHLAVAFRSESVSVTVSPKALVISFRTSFRSLVTIGSHVPLLTAATALPRTLSFSSYVVPRWAHKADSRAASLVENPSFSS